MSTAPPKYYPGDEATPHQVRQLADEYRRAALHLLEHQRKGQPLSQAPFRLSAIHAIELYMNALLLHWGHHPGTIRGLHHDLARRTGLVFEGGLVLKSRTRAHLRRVAENREYLVMRYGPEVSAVRYPPNRLTATLDEVAKKVTEQLARKAAPSR